MPLGNGYSEYNPAQYKKEHDAFPARKKEMQGLEANPERLWHLRAMGLSIEPCPDKVTEHDKHGGHATERIQLSESRFWVIGHVL
jgi:hypothetical protein